MASFQKVFRSIHIHATEPVELCKLISSSVPCTVDEARYLLKMGAIYKQIEGFTKPKRVFENVTLSTGDYVRIHPSPRRYNTNWDWQKRILFECSEFLVINKPPSIPTCPTRDNYHESVVSSLQQRYPTHKLYLPHRLDTDTTGALIIAKTKLFVTRFGKLLYDRAVTKRYRALIAYCVDQHDRNIQPENNGRNTFSFLHKGFHLVNALAPSVDSPKLFSQVDISELDVINKTSITELFAKLEGGGGHDSKTVKGCISVVNSVSKPVSKTAKDWRHWVDSKLICSSCDSYAETESSNDRTLEISRESKVQKAIYAWTSVYDAINNSDVESSSESGRYGCDHDFVHNDCENRKSVAPLLVLQEVELELVTGRTHQVRGQLQSLRSHCLLDKYSAKTKPALPNQTTIASMPETIAAANSTLHTYNGSTIHVAGDNLYAGSTTLPATTIDSFRSSPHLALQAYQIALPLRNGDFDMVDTETTSNAVLVSELNTSHSKRPPDGLKKSLYTFSVPKPWWHPLWDLLYP